MSYSEEFGKITGRWVPRYNLRKWDPHGSIEWCLARMKSGIIETSMESDEMKYGTLIEMKVRMKPGMGTMFFNETRNWQ